MTTAPTPAPHVPVSFLKAGGSAFFSAQCIALLAEYDYHPDDFGTYEGVQARCGAARREVAAWERRGRTPPTPDARTMELGAPVRDEAQHYQSGHIGLNTAMQRDRGDPCSNVTLGHRDELYPCMPHQGSALVDGTEHNRWTVREFDTPLSRGAPRSTYPASEMDHDSNRRIRALLREREERLHAQGRGQNIGQMALGTQGERAQAVSAAEGARAAALGNRDALPADQQITGNTAEECISNFRDGAVSGLRAHCASDDQIARNDALARGERPDGTPRADMPRRRANESPEAYRARLDQDAAAARARADAAQAPIRSEQGRVNAYTGHIRASRAEYAANPTRENYERIMRQREAQQAARDRLRAARENHRDLSREAGAAQGAATRANNAECLARQGRTLANNPDAGRDGRRPGPWSDLPRGSFTPGQNTRGED